MSDFTKDDDKQVARDWMLAKDLPASPEPVETEPILPTQSANTATPEEIDALKNNLQAPAVQEQPVSVEEPQSMDPVPQQDEQTVPEAEKSAPEPVPKPVIQPINAQDLKNEDVGVQQDLSAGHIRPQTYQDLFAKKDTLGKIGTIFGLLIGGAGAGLSHQPNALLTMMDNEIKNDFEAQKENQSNSQVMTKLNMERQMNLANLERMKKEGLINDQQLKAASLDFKIKNDAMDMMLKRRAALHSLVDKVNKLPVGSPNRISAERQLATLSEAVQGANFDLADQAAAKSAFMNAMFGGNGGGAGGSEQAFQEQQNRLRMMGMAPLAEANEQKHLPGVKGQASIPLTSEDREKILSGVQFQNQLQRFINWTKSNSGNLNPKAINEGQALAAELSSAYRAAIGGGVYKAGEQDFINKVIDEDPTKFFNSIRVLPKLEAVKGEAEHQLNERLKSKGFDGLDLDKKKEESIAISKSRSGRPMVQVDGKWYYKKAH